MVYVRTQHFRLRLENARTLFVKPRPNDRNIINATYRNMLRAFGLPVATCWVLLAQISRTIFKLQPTTPNLSQHIATWWPNAHTMLCLTMLRYAALTCCDRLAGALKNYSICVWHHSSNLWQFLLCGYFGVITFSFWLIFSLFH